MSEKNAERDPRKDPRPGDVLQVGDERERVTSVSRSHVRCTSGFRVCPGSRFFMESAAVTDKFSHKAWNRWAKDAEVIHRAE